MSAPSRSGNPKLRWIQRTSKMTNRTPEPLAPAFSLWSEAWEPALAWVKYHDGEELNDTELLELVEYGALSIVPREWLARDHATNDEVLDGGYDAEASETESEAHLDAGSGCEDPEDTDGGGRPAGAVLPAAEAGAPWPAGDGEGPDQGDDPGDGV